MRYFNLILFLVIVGFTCGDQLDSFGERWVKNFRFQAGEYVMFVGQGESLTQHEAEAFAEGMALTSMVKECGVISKRAKFHETCLEEKDGGFVVYKRISVEVRYCNKDVAPNPVLMDQYFWYQNYKSKNTQLNRCLVEVVDLYKKLDDIRIRAIELLKLLNNTRKYTNAHDILLQEIRVNNSMMRNAAVEVGGKIDECQKYAF